jgi:hypothetical protein
VKFIHNKALICETEFEKTVMKDALICGEYKMQTRDHLNIMHTAKVVVVQSVLMPYNFLYFG